MLQDLLSHFLCMGRDDIINVRATFRVDEFRRLHADRLWNELPNARTQTDMHSGLTSHAYYSPDRTYAQLNCQLGLAVRTLITVINAQWIDMNVRKKILNTIVVHVCSNFDLAISLYLSICCLYCKLYYVNFI